MAKQFSVKEIKEHIRLGIFDYRLPAWAKREIDKKRRRLNREALSPDQEMDQFMREEHRAQPYIEANSTKGRIIRAVRRGLPRGIVRNIFTDE